MDTIECINSKRSIRAYEETQIPYETVMELLTLGTKASTGSNHPPWGFVVIQDAQEIEDLSKNIKAYLLENLEKYILSGQLEQDFKDGCENDRFYLLELLEKLMDVSELADAAATRLIFRGLPVPPPLVVL